MSTGADTGVEIWVRLTVGVALCLPLLAWRVWLARSPDNPTLLSSIKADGASFLFYVGATNLSTVLACESLVGPWRWLQVPLYIGLVPLNIWAVREGRLAAEERWRPQDEHVPECSEVLLGRVGRGRSVDVLNRGGRRGRR